MSGIIAGLVMNKKPAHLSSPMHKAAHFSNLTVEEEKLLTLHSPFFIWKLSMAELVELLGPFGGTRVYRGC